MPFINFKKSIVITNSGGNLVQPSSETFDTYEVSGSATMIGNLQITPSGTIVSGLTYYFIWKANLDIVTNSTTVTVFGKALTAVQVTKLNYITASYNGSSWDVDVQTSDGNTAFIENFQLGANIVQASNIANGAIGSTQIFNSSITLNKLATDSVDSSKIVDLTIQTIDLDDAIVTTQKIVDLNVTTQKINDLAVTEQKINNGAVTTQKILDYNVTANKIGSNAVTTVKILDANVTTDKVLDDAITNSKLAQMTPSSIKTGDSSGNPTDLFIGLDEIPIGNGTSVTTINKSSLTNYLLVGDLYVYHYPLSFEATAQAHNRVYIPFAYHLEAIYTSTVTTLAGTDDGYLDVFTPTGSYQATLAWYPFVPSGSLQNDFQVFNTPASNALDVLTAFGGWLDIRVSKTTPGGTVLATVVVKRL